MRTVYTVDELTGRARERALAKLAKWATGEDWWEDVYAQATEALAWLGFDTSPKLMQFSGFWSQGDGASFTGTWRADRLDLARLYAERPMDKALHALAIQLQAFALEFPLAEATITRGGSRYSHAYTMTVDSYPQGDRDEADVDGLGDSDPPIQPLIRGCADWLYAQLEAEYECLTDEAQLIENTQANEYEFEEDGSIA